MNSKRGIFAIAISSILTIIFVRMALSFILSDYTFSIIPGWYTQLTENFTLNGFTLTIISSALIINAVFIIVYKLLTRLIRSKRS